MNALKGYRTLLLAALVELLTLWQTTAPTGVIPARWEPFAAGLIPIAFGVLRFVTTTPVGNKTSIDLTDPQVQALIAKLEADFEPKLVAAHPGIQGIDLGGYAKGVRYDNPSPIAAHPDAIGTVPPVVPPAA